MCPPCADTAEIAALRVRGRLEAAALTQTASSSSEAADGASVGPEGSTGYESTASADDEPPPFVLPQVSENTRKRNRAEYRKSLGEKPGAAKTISAVVSAEKPPSFRPDLAIKRDKTRANMETALKMDAWLEELQIAAAEHPGGGDEWSRRSGELW